MSMNMQSMTAYALTQPQWLLCKRVSRFIWGVWDKPSVFIEGVRCFLSEQQSMLNAGKEAVLHMKHLLMNRYARYLVQRWEHIDGVIRIGDVWTYAQYDKNWARYASSRIVLNKESAWSMSIPMSWHNDCWGLLYKWLYATDILCDFSKRSVLVEYHWYGYQLAYGSIVDLPKMWDRYQVLMARIDQHCVDAIEQTWFWQYMCRRFFCKIRQDIKREQEVLIESLKQRLSPKNSRQTIALLLLHKGFYEKLFPILYSQEDIQSLLLNWQLYEPESFVMYKGVSGRTLNDAECVIWEHKDQWLLSESIKVFANDGYSYARVIEELFNSEPKPYLVNCYKETRTQFGCFWYQARHMAAYYQKMQYVHFLDAQIDAWVYSHAQFKQQGDEALDISRIPMDKHLWMLGRYGQCLHVGLVNRYSRLLHTWSFLQVVQIPYEQVMQSQILWRSVNLILNVSNYAKHLYAHHIRMCVASHHHLPQDVAQMLQAYMVTVAKYVWRARCEPRWVLSLCEDLEGIESSVWKKGMVGIGVYMAGVMNQPSIKHSIGENR